MPSRRIRLSQHTVADTTPETKEFVLWDEALPGFGLRVRPTGRKTYIAKYRVKGALQAQRKVAIGSTSHITCAVARDRARTLMAEARLGIDTSACARAEAPKPVTLSAFWAQYDRDHVEIYMKARSAEAVRRLARLVLLPRLGEIPLESIDAARIRALHLALRGTPTQANRVLSLLSAVIGKATQWGILPDRPNPCRLIDKYKESHRDRFLTEAELQRLVVSLNQHARLNPVFADAIRLILFTGLRKTEALALKWAEVDVVQSRLNLADSKTGKKSIPLNATALDLLKSVRDRSGRTDPAGADFVFPGRDSVTGDRSSHAVGIQKFWSRVRHDAGLDDVRIHDLRHSFASFAAESGVSLVVIGGLLGQKDVRSTSRYAHLTDTALRRASHQTGDTIARAIGNATRNA